MNDVKEFSLPASGYDVIAKILHAYVLCGDTPVNLADVASKSGLHHTMVSRNNSFLAALGLIQGGKAKTLTEDGKRLAIALSNDQREDIAQAWKRALEANSATSGVLHMLQVQKGVPENQVRGKIATSLGLPAGKGTTLGINTLIEVMTNAGVITIADGNVLLASAPTTTKAGDEQQPAAAVKKPDEPASAPKATPPLGLPQTATPQNLGKLTLPVHVNIELHLPASSEQSVYDALFKSIRENLLQ